MKTGTFEKALALAIVFTGILVLVGTIYLGYRSMTAPCEELGYMPVKDLPARCLDHVRPR